MTELTSPDEIESVLRAARVVAVLGAHPESTRPAFYVPDYLQRAGYRILPVNPTQAECSLFGEPVRASLRDLDVPVDIVDVFRRADHLPGHLPEILDMNPLPSCVWFQLGIRNDDVAAALTSAGIDVVQDRCTLADHKRWLAVRFDERHREHLLDKGRELANQLADLMAGKDVPLYELQGAIGGDRHKREDRLRAYLALIEGRREAFDTRDPGWGRCASCGRTFAPAQLDEMPWVTQCQRCEST